MPDVRYVTKVGRHGWLLVQMDSGEKISLPQFLKVQIGKTQNGRDFFRILEGVYKGKTGTVSLKFLAPPVSYFSNQLRQASAATVKFAVDEQKLWFGTNQTPINAFSVKSPRKTPAPKGTYKLQIPYAPSAETRVQYYTWTDFHKTWFRLNLDPLGDRFLHVGEISHGCVTVRPFMPDMKNFPMVSTIWPKRRVLHFKARSDCLYRPARLTPAAGTTSTTTSSRPVRTIEVSAR